MFGKLFGKKDHHHYLTKGGKHLAAERYADARIDLQEALRLCPAEAAEKGEIQAGLNRAGNALGQMNLTEGEHSLNAGELAKARDHFILAGELAVDQTIKTMAGEGLKKLAQHGAAPAAPAYQAASAASATAAPATAKAAPATAAEAWAQAQAATKQSAHHGGSSCGSCKDSGSHHAAPEEIPALDFSEEDQFHLLVAPLPGDLPGRYSAMGPEFARAYLLIHDGKDNESLPILQKMLVSAENDIVIYEVALIMFRKGKIHECEALLNRALSLNPINPACHLGKVHLLAEAGRAQEAIDAVQHMIEHGILADQAQFILGELYQATGNEAAALEVWSKSLEVPSMARAAAERIVPILGSQGRTEEAKYLIKRYLKGCC